MGQGQIKKGFFFYFGLFVLVIVAIFLICLVVMMFNPGSTVLWMQYFTNNTTYYVESTTAENEEDSVVIDWDTISNVEIECTYADVVVERDHNEDYDKTGIYVVNNAKGFTGASSAVQFNISATFAADGTLKIVITEPTGFLYFSKTIRVILHASNLNDPAAADPNFENINLKITTTSGDVSLGGSAPHTSDEAQTKLASVDVTTGSGSINFTKYMDVASLDSISLKTTSGEISSNYEVSYALNGTSKTVNGIETGCDVSLYTEKGSVDLDVIKTSGIVTITNKSGSIVLGDVIASSLDFSSCESGNYKLNNYASMSTGGIVTFGSSDTVISPNIVFGNIYGSFGFYANNDSSSPTISINRISGQLTVLGYNGSLDVNEAMGVIDVSGSSLSVDIIVAESNVNQIKIATEKGAVRLGFAGAVSGLKKDESNNDIAGVIVSSKSGAVTVDITTAAVFTANMYAYDGTAKDVSKITLNIGNLSDDSSKNPLVVNNAGTSDGVMSITTDSNVKFNLVTSM